MSFKRRFDGFRGQSCVRATPALGGFLPSQKVPGNGRNRRIADVADRGLGRLNWAGKRTYRGRQQRRGVRPKLKAAGRKI